MYICNATCASVGYVCAFIYVCTREGGVEGMQDVPSIEVAQTLRLRQPLPSPLRAPRLPHAYIGHNGEVSSPSHKCGVGEYEVEAGAPWRSSGEVRLGVQWRW